MTTGRINQVVPTSAAPVSPPSPSADPSPAGRQRGLPRRAAREYFPSLIDTPGPAGNPSGKEWVGAPPVLILAKNTLINCQRQPGCPTHLHLPGNSPQRPPAPEAAQQPKGGGAGGQGSASEQGDGQHPLIRAQPRTLFTQGLGGREFCKARRQDLTCHIVQRLQSLPSFCFLFTENGPANSTGLMPDTGTTKPSQGGQD